MNKYINLVKTLLLLSLFVFLVSFTTKRNNERKVKEIVFERNEKNVIKNDILVNIINQNSSIELGNKLHKIDLFSIEKNVDNYSFIKKSQIYTTPEGIIYSTIEEEKPIIRIKTPIKEFYLTEDEKAISLSKIFSPEVIVGQGDIKKEEFSSIAKLVKYINDDNLLKNHIVGIRKVGLNFYTFSTQSGFSIEFGSLTKIDEKFDNLKLFYEQYLSKVPLGTYRKISLRFNNQIVATK